MLRVSEASSEPVLAASLVQGPAVVLGAKQRAGRVLNLEACEKVGTPVMRRATTGTAAWLPELGIVFALALPNVASLLPDATARTLLNRNVRLFLKGFTKAGVLAHYFGREWISLRKQPAALLGFEVTRTGAVLIEVLVGFDEPTALPAYLATSEERALDRWQGKSVVSVREVFPDATIEAFATNVIEAMVERAGAQATAFASTISLEEVPPITDEVDPAPQGFVLQPLARVPIGYVEAAYAPDEPHRRWLGGDVLAPTWVYDDIAAGKGNAEMGEVAIDGATVLDLVEGLNTK